MYDGKEIEASKLLELFYIANDIPYTQYLGSTKDSSFFQFNENGVNYTISPSNVYSKSQGENIKTSNIFESDDKNALQKLTGSDLSTSTEDCNSTIQKKMHNSNLWVKDFNIASMQDQFINNPNSLEEIRKEQLAKHYSLDDISYQLGIPELLKSNTPQDQMKAHCLLMSYLNNQSYNLGSDTEKQHLSTSDGYAFDTSYMQELFFKQNNINYHKDENGNLIFNIGNEEYYWKYEYNALLSEKALSQNLLSNQTLINAKTHQKVNFPRLSELEEEKVKGVIPLSLRIPTSEKELSEMSEKLSEINTSIKDEPHSYSIEQQALKRAQNNTIAKNSSNKYNEYLEMKSDKKDFYSKDDNVILEEYKQKVKNIAQDISSNCKTDEEKALAVMEYIRLSGRYENIDKSEYYHFKIGSRLSQDGMSYALTGEGVCSSQAEFTNDILNELGLESNVEICQVENNPNVSISNSSNHKVTRVKLNGKSIILDPTHYDGTLESLQFPNNLSISNAYSIAENYANQMKLEGKSDEEINSVYSKIIEAYKIQEQISAETFKRDSSKLKLITPFGSKTLKQLHFNTLDTTNEEIANARKIAGNIAIKDYGIDKISENLSINETSNPLDKQSTILGFIEDNLQKPEFDNMKNIKSRIVSVGDKSLELNDALELFYMANGIDYNINSDHNLSVDLGNELASIDTLSAYKHSLPVEQERNQLLKSKDNSFIKLSQSIQKSIDTMHNKDIAHNNFVSHYKVSGANCKYDPTIDSEKSKENVKSKEQSEMDDDDFYPGSSRF